MMYSVNFEPLASEWPELYRFATQAENVAYTDPNTCVMKLRCFAEKLLNTIYENLQLPLSPSDTFFGRLKSKHITRLLGSDVLAKFHTIRIAGNKAAHGNTNITVADAKRLILEAYVLAKWLYITMGRNTAITYPPFADVQPKNTYNKISEAQLTKQLEAVKGELAGIAHIPSTSIASHNNGAGSIVQQQLQEKACVAMRFLDAHNDNSQQLIKIHDVFLEYNLTTTQTQLINALNDFLNNSTHDVFLLRGYAGTGKTFIAKGLTEYFRAIGRNFVLTAPTGKAAKVIAKKTGEEAYTLHKTIYSFDRMKEFREEDLEGSQTYKIYAPIVINNNSADTVYIVDEASMVSDIYQEHEFFRCGSGYLLRDFFSYVNLDHNDHRKKVIFIGDNAQLPPVNMALSPALSTAYLKEHFTVRITEFELTEVVRQKSNSGILNNATTIRQALAKKTFNQLLIDTKTNNITELTHDQVVSTFLECSGHTVNDRAVVIAYSNADVCHYNRDIRSQLFPNQTEITRGDKVMVISNNNTYGFFICNGDFGFVRAVSAHREHRSITIKNKDKETGRVCERTITLTFREVEIGFRDPDGQSRFFAAHILEDLLYSEKPQLDSDQNKALYIDFCIRHPQLTPGTAGFRDALQTDRYFNALRLKFGYAITCHKAQGSEWDNVILKCHSNTSQLCSEYFRWLYTAITRTSDQLFILNPPKISLGIGKNTSTLVTAQNLVGNFTETPQQLSKINTDFPENAFLPPNFEQLRTLSSNIIDAPSKTTIPSVIDQNVNNMNSVDNFYTRLGAIIQAHIDGYGITINDIQHNQNQEAYFFSQNGYIARINFIYNNNGKITNIVSTQLSLLGQQLQSVFQPLLNQSIRVATIATIEFSFSNTFLEELHQQIMSYISGHQLCVDKIEEQPYCQQYTFSRGTEVAVYRFYYNNNKKPTRREAVASRSSESLVQDLRVIFDQEVYS